MEIRRTNVGLCAVLKHNDKGWHNCGKPAAVAIRLHRSIKPDLRCAECYGYLKNIPKAKPIEELEPL